MRLGIIKHIVGVIIIPNRWIGIHVQHLVRSRGRKSPTATASLPVPSELPLQRRNAMFPKFLSAMASEVPDWVFANEVQSHLNGATKVMMFAMRPSCGDLRGFGGFEESG